MKKLFASLFFALALAVNGADLVTVSLTVTNGTTTNDNVTINGSVRGAALTGSATNWIATNSPAVTASNIFNHLGSYPAAGVLISMQNATNVTLKGIDLSVAQFTNFSVLVFTTNKTTNVMAMLYPFTSLNVNVATNQGANIVSGLSYASNSVAEGVGAMSNYVQRGASQTIGNKTITNSVWTNGTITGATLNNAIVNATNGFMTNIYGLNWWVTNLWPSSTGSLSVCIGLGIADNNAIAVGVGASATNAQAVVIGFGARSGSNNAVAIGTSTSAKSSGAAVGNSAASGQAAVAVGNNSSSLGYWSLALGDYANAAYENSVAIGHRTTASGLNDFLIGNSSNTVRIGGIMANVTSINNVMTGSNVVNGNQALLSFALSTLAAGPNNITAPTNVVVLLSGPTGDFSIDGVAAGWAGRYHILRNTTAYQLTISHESGLAAAAGDRINTPNSMPVTIPAGEWFSLWYDSTASRWRSINYAATGKNIYGALMMNATNIVTCPGASDVYTNLGTFNVIATNGIYGALSSTAAALTNLYAGYYRITCSASFLGQNSQPTEWGVFTNGVECTPIEFKKTFDTSARTDSGSMSGIIYLPASCRTDFRVQDFGNGQSIAIHRASLVISLP